ncbi:MULTISPECIES: hypothetical protein [unclassified Streptomyces]|uniref:hypothetical protein n=1 Tax=unclassified Streptomyces TaxID=2593676 RepID=UPI0035D79154
MTTTSPGQRPAGAILEFLPKPDATSPTLCGRPRPPGLDEQIVQTRPQTPKTDREKKRELRKQRRRLQDAGRRRFVAGQSRRPRSRQNRIGNAAARRDARALSRVRHSTAWLW